MICVAGSVHHPLQRFAVSLPRKRGRIEAAAGRTAGSSPATRGRGTTPPGLAAGKPEDSLRVVEGGARGL